MKTWLICIGAYCICQPLYAQFTVTEIFPNPADTGIVEEFVELVNLSKTHTDLSNWQWSDSRKSIVLPDTIIPAGATYILTPSTCACNWPALNNDKDSVSLVDPDGDVSFTFTYNQSMWYGNQKGRSLHRLNPDIPCLDHSFWLDNDPNPGTFIFNQPPIPKIDRIIADDTLLYIVNEEDAFPTNWHFLEFQSNNAPFELLLADFGSNWACFSTINALSVPKSLDLSIIFCAASPIHDIGTFYPEKLDFNAFLVINEVLFDPNGTFLDFIELTNWSENEVVLKDLELLHVHGADTTFIYLWGVPEIIQPKEMLFLHKTGDNEVENAKIGPNTREFPLNSFPNLLNEGGELILQSNGKILDHMKYGPELHHPIISNTEGVSLQRISPNHSGLDPDNWTSTSAMDGYATPGQWSPTQLEVQQHYFTPNGDGFQDLMQWHLPSNDAGLVLSAEIWNINGNLTRQLANNQPSWPGDLITWDGMDESGQLAPMGNYVLRVHVFDLEGRIQKWSAVVALIR